MRPQSKISTTWRAELAYAVGLLATDGCLCNDGRHIDFTSQDIQLVRTFKKCLGLTNKIGLKTNGYSNVKYSRVQFGDVNFYKWLVGIGVTPHKSKTIDVIKIPNEFFFDFLRGHFDGDGSCYSYWDKRWVNSFMFYMYFYSASEKHIAWLRGKIKKLLGVSGSIWKSKKDNVCRLKFAKKEAKIIISKIYYRKELPCLQRKLKKIQIILATDSKKSRGCGEMATALP